jgi:conjugative relaxase-like TrwC/TraI family protein
MLSIASVSSGQAVHYYSEKDNYYSNESGQWQGKGAEVLGLKGDVDQDDFLNLLEGKDLDGEQVVQSGIGDHKGERRAAVDLTFSAPKSVSILAEVIGGEKGEEIIEAHNAAVSQTLDYIEGHYTQARQYKEGRVNRVDTDNLLIGVFRHNLSRELDPQLHTHAVVINQTVREDGKTVALDYKEIFDNKLFLGQLYRNELAKNLSDQGFNTTSNEKGFFEINGVDQTLIDTFSKRSGQIDNELAKLKESGRYENANVSRLKEIAGLGSRTPKHDVEIENVKENWARQLNDMDFDREKIIKDVEDAADSFRHERVQQSDPLMNEYDYIRAAAEIITQQESTFSKEDLLRTAGKLSIGEHRVPELEQAFNELINDKELFTLHEQYNVYTTQHMYHLESQIMEKVSDGKGQFHEVMSKEEVQQSINHGYSNLTEDQKGAVEHILTSNDFVVGIQGSAGTGKTTMLNAVKVEAVNHEISVRGMAFTGKAAEELQEGLGIESRTVHSFLSMDTKQSGDREIWIVDEASMLGSRQMHALLEKASDNNAQVVLVGDTKQLQAIDSGPIFDRLQSSGVMNTENMNTIVRQAPGYMRDVATLIQVTDRIDSALSKLSDQNRIYEIQDRDERLSAITRDYVSRDNPSHSLIITGINNDRNDINNAIRDELKSLGRLKGSEHTYVVREAKNIRPEEKRFAQSYKEGDLIYARKAGVMGRAGTEARITDIDHIRHIITAESEKKVYSINLMKDGDKLSAYSEKEKSFMEGDHIAFTKNDKMLGVKNGLRGELTSLNESGDMTVSMANGREVAFNVDEYNYIDNAYAVTTYKSQGQSVNDVYYHADTTKDVNYNEFYVSLTRSRNDIHIYTDDKETLREQVKNIQEKTFSQDYKYGKNEMSNDKTEDRELENRFDEKDNEADNIKNTDTEKDLAHHKSDLDEQKKDGNEKEKESPDIVKHDDEIGLTESHKSENERELAV